LRLSITVVFFFFSSCTTLFAEPWHQYKLDKLVNEQSQPRALARMRFMYNELNFWAAVSVAAELELEYHAAGGGVSGYCSASKGAKLLRCQAYIKSYILRAQNCNILAKQQLRLLRN